jgi:D-alanyl-D-alanine carboxypeptidase/D-alanyl-D-alanine-endopeptidase (penicillin-binding protein 4)
MFWGAVTVLCAQGADTVRTLDELRQQIDTHLAEAKFSEALWGIKVVSLESGKTLYEHHADRLMSPASNTKLYTGAITLAQLGGNYHFETPVYAVGKISSSGTLHGDLVVVGHGDPSWNDRRLGTNFWTVFDPFVAVLTNAGIRRISGDVIGDATFFHGKPTGSGWSVDDLSEGEAGMISALTLEDNLAQLQISPGEKAGDPCRFAMMQPGTGLTFSNEAVTVAAGAPARIRLYRPLDGKNVFILGGIAQGSEPQMFDMAVPKPSAWFAAALKIALERHGIKVSGNTRGLAWPDKKILSTNSATKLGAVMSPPLSEVVRGFMKPSQNLEADTLLADVGEATWQSNAPEWRTSADAGLGALGPFLYNIGIPYSEVQFDEGSGLSRENLTTANATVTLLQYMDHHREGQNFYDALPIAGVDGTLRRRYHGTLAAGNVHAKTGTLHWAQAQSGYVTSAAGERLAFSIMLNRFVAAPGGSGHDEIAPVVLALANFAGRSDDLTDVYSSYGTLILTNFASAPFPHPDRTQGHAYHDEFYSTKFHYLDSTVGIFIPKGFRVTDKVDFVVHFHGWRHTVAGTLPEYNLIGQFVDSGKNAILIVPQGPKGVPDSFGGKLEDTNGFKVFMDEAVEKLRASGVLGRTDFDLGNVIISGHSGGFHVMAAILDHGGMSDKIKETWLFDALYAGTEDYAGWQKRENGRLLDIYTDHGGTKGETENLMAAYKKQEVPFFFSEDVAASPGNLETNKIVFLHTDLIHNDVVSKRGEFCQFLKTSGLQNK